MMKDSLRGSGLDVDPIRETITDCRNVCTKLFPSHYVSSPDTVLVSVRGVLLERKMPLTSIIKTTVDATCRPLNMNLFLVGLDMSHGSQTDMMNSLDIYLQVSWIGCTQLRY